jgi:hypothetical protein
MPLYVYAVVRPRTPTPDGVTLVEPSLGALRLVPAGRVAALAAGFGAPKVRMTPSNLRGHHDVVDRVAKEEDLVPVQFGVVFESDSSLVADLLAPREEELWNLLETFSGRVEVRVTTTYLGDAALRDAVAANRELQRSDRRGRSGRQRATYHDQIALGELAMHEVANVQRRDLRDLSQRVSSTVDAQRLVRAAADGSARLAFLVRRDRLEAFEGALEDFTQGQEDRMHVELVGPVAPWDFVDLGELGKLGMRESAVGTGR